MLEYAFLTFSSLFAIVDPFAAIPTFVALTARDTVEQRKRMARIACATCAGVMSGFAVCGPTLFHALGITLAAFQTAGGLVLLLSALDMVRAQKSGLRQTPEEYAEASEKESIAITPLAIPLLSGPGAITTTIVMSGRAATVSHKIILFAMILLVAFISYVVFTIVASGAKRLTPTVMNIITRLMGLLLAAVGVQFIMTALHFV